jgi:hypothetical protein
MTSDNAFWQFDPPNASLRCGSVSGRVDVSRPQLGLHDLRVNSTAIPGALLSAAWFADEETASAAHGPADWPMPVADAYVRGGDLVATFGRMPNSPYSPQIYWRVEQVAGSTELGGLSLIVSVQTDLLDSHPQIRVTTRLAADELIRIDSHSQSEIRNQKSEILPACLLWRLPGGKLSYAEIVPQSDFRQVTMARDANGVATAHWDLFAEFLEKGVIRRARIHAVFLPRQDDIELATGCCRLLERRPLPLTT